MPRRAISEPSHVHVTIVAEGTEIVGSLGSVSDIRIDGSMNGELKVDGQVVVSENGKITGQLSANAAVIAGTVKGDLLIEQKLTLSESAHVEGSIHTSRLVVEEGAVFQGDCMMQPRSRSRPSEGGPVAVEPVRRAAA
ncbi:MAG: polymer-forming cytoskeletal protein [Bacteroidota bacterium]|nr:polymer-forming cytoskeletal protein [Bacteroidota bacterium]MDE2834680.1 polymer-forming cytoskeletal protein [Bacteroidota bacterium]